MLYETHSHTPLCKHAVGSPEEYAAVAEQRGLLGIVLTCHNPMPDGFSARVRMGLDEFDVYQEMVARATDAWRGRVDVRLGLEADYFAGYEPFLEQQIASCELHYVLGSVHPQISEYRARYWSDDPTETQCTYFQLLAQAAETGLFDSISHPDLIKNETSTDWFPDRIFSEICRTLDRIAKTGLAMELNTSGANKVIPEMNPFPDMLNEIASRGIPIVIGADAHVPHRVGDRFEEALDLLEHCGFTEVNYFLDRKRHPVKIVDARASLRPLPSAAATTS